MAESSERITIVAAAVKASPTVVAAAAAVTQLRSRYIVNVCETGRKGTFEENEQRKKKQR